MTREVRLGARRNLPHEDSQEKDQAAGGAGQALPLEAFET